MQLPIEAIEKFLRAVRARVVCAGLLRATLTLLGALVPAFAVLAALVGPVAPATLPLVAWAAMVLLAASIAFPFARAAWRLRGRRISAALDRIHPSLASQTRTALELARIEHQNQGDRRADPIPAEASNQPLGFAPGLVAAHAKVTAQKLHDQRPADAVDWTWLRGPNLWAPIVGTLLGALLLLGVERTRAGAFALLHPSLRQHGRRVAAVVDEVDYMLSFPDHLRQAPTVAHDPRTLRVPAGTLVRLRVVPGVEATQGALRIGGRSVALSLDASEESLGGQFVADASGELTIAILLSDETEVIDATPRRLLVERDAAPIVRLRTPDRDVIAEPQQTILVDYDAEDDVGLGRIEFVVESPDGTTRRRTLFERGAKRPVRKTPGTTSFSPAEFGAQPGDTLKFWIEARDEDLVSGPKRGQSTKRTVSIPSEHSRRAQALDQLTALLDLALSALANRLEEALPEESEAAQTRARKLSTQSRALVESLARLDGDPLSAADFRLLRAHTQKLEATLAVERRRYHPVVRSAEQRESADAAVTDALEALVLTLADAVRSGQKRDAAALVHELEELRQRMAELLARFRANGDSEIRAQLMADLGRARARISELMQRLARMNLPVPGDFANLQSADQRKPNPLSALQEALDAQNFEAAERNLFEIERTIDAVTSMLAKDAFDSGSAPGPQEQAFAQALDRLADLESEQRRLAGRTAELERTASERAARSETNRRAADLQSSATRARKALERLRDSPYRTPNGELLDRAFERVSDAEKALESGDLSEAIRMAAEGEQEAKQLSRDLRISSLMFPGSDHAVADAARASNEAVSAIRKLHKDLQQSIPDIERHLKPGERRQIVADSPVQRSAARSIRDLAETFDQGPTGAPLSPDAAQDLRKVARVMDQSVDPLARGELREAADQQRQAAERLASIRRQLEQGGQSQSRGSEGGSGGVEPRLRPKVRIPGAAEGSRAGAERSRLLEAMREGAPPGYEESIRHYYEELLR